MHIYNSLYQNVISNVKSAVLTRELIWTCVYTKTLGIIIIGYRIFVGVGVPHDGSGATSVDGWLFHVTNVGKQIDLIAYLPMAPIHSSFSLSVCANIKYVAFSVATSKQCLNIGRSGCIGKDKRWGHLFAKLYTSQGPLVSLFFGRLDS